MMQEKICHRENISKVIVRGINWSGSGAVVDLLREYEGFVQVPGGLPKIETVGILQYQEFRDYDTAINQTLGETITDNHIDHIKNYILTKKKILLKDYLKNCFNLRNPNQFLTLNRESYLIYKLIKATERYANSLTPKASKSLRLSRGREWVNEIVSITLRTKNSNFIIFDHTVDLGLTTDIWSDIFRPFKMIIVIRHPYDQYLEKLRVDYFESPFRKKIINERYGENERATLLFFLDQTRESQAGVDRILESLEKDIVMVVRFEDLITKYHEMKLKIEKFLDIDPKSHKLKRKYLDPEVSINNVGLYDSNIHEIPVGLFEPAVNWYLQH